MIQVDDEGQAILNDPPQQNRDASRREQEQLQAADTSISTEQKDTLGTDEGIPESTRNPKVVMSDEPRSEEKYIAKMPNGAFCVLSHETNKVIKCFDTRKEAENFLKRKPKKNYDNIEELGVSLEEAEVLMESQFEIEPENSKAANPKDVFDNPGEAMNRSKELSCAVGVHTHEVNGKKVFMPCKTHDAYEEAVKPKKAEKPKKDRTNLSLIHI